MKKICASIVAVVLFGASCTSDPPEIPPSPSPTVVVPSSPAVPVPSGSPTPTLDIYENRPYRGPKPLNILILGSDGRLGHSRKCSPNSNADVIHIFSYHPDKGRGVFLNIPRDTWVPIPGHGRGKITEAMAFGGPELVIKSLERLTKPFKNRPGIKIHYYALTTFCRFIDLVDALGGVRVYVTKTFSDENALFKYGGQCKKHKLKKGWHNLSGCEALVYARSRKVWPGGDWDRTTHQAEILLAGFAKLKSLSFVETLKLVKKHVKFNVPLSQQLALFNLARKIDPITIRNCTLPSRSSWVGEISVVYLDAAAYGIFSDVAKDAYTSKPCKNK